MGGKNRKSKGYVGGPPTAITNGRREKSSSSCGVNTGIWIVVIGAIALYLFAFGGLDEVLDLLNIGDDDNGGALNLSDQAFEEIEQDQVGDYIGLGFLQDLSNETEIRDAFFSAARRWSDVVDGTPYTPQSFAAGQPFCTGTDEGFVEDITITFLVIVVTLEPIGGGVLGSAGPCFFNPSTFRSITGRMTFDIDSIPGLIADGSFESVILHEMGHVLGIGTLWDTANVLFNPVFDGNIINLNNQPEFRGTSALAEYRDLVNDQTETFVPVEDGVFEGTELFNRAAGAGGGSIDGHWDKDFFQGELMEFQIQSGAVPPMSRTTIASLADLNYNVDLTLAEAYTPPSSSLFSRLRGSNKKTISLAGDIDTSAMKPRN